MSRWDEGSWYKNIIRHRRFIIIVNREFIAFIKQNKKGGLINRPFLALLYEVGI